MIQAIRILSLLLLFEATPAIAKPVTVVLDMPEYMAKDHAVHVILGLMYEDGRPIAFELLSRQELRDGVMSKQIELRDGEELIKCTAVVGLMTNPPLPADAVIPLLAPQELLSKPAEGKCSWSEDGSVAYLRLPYSFEDVTINIAAEALVDHSAFLLRGELIYDTIEKPFKFLHSARGEAETLRLHVVAPEPVSRTLDLKWSKAGDEDERQQLEVLKTTIDIQ